MKIYSVSSVNYSRKYSARQPLNQNQNNTVKSTKNNPAFKGAKGAAIGALGGLAYLGVVALMAGPLMPITLGAVALCGGAGAIAGHNIEKDFKNDKDNNNK